MSIFPDFTKIFAPNLERRSIRTLRRWPLMKDRNRQLIPMTLSNERREQNASILGSIRDFSTKFCIELKHQTTTMPERAVPIQDGSGRHTEFWKYRYLCIGWRYLHQIWWVGAHVTKKTQPAVNSREVIELTLQLENCIFQLNLQVVNIGLFTTQWTHLPVIIIIIITIILRQCLWCCHHGRSIARVHPVHLMNVERRQAAADPRPSQTT